MKRLRARMGKISQWLKQPGSKKKLAIRSSVIGLLALLFVGLSAEYTSRPTFCPTCHYMEPYYDSWLAAPAHAEVSCVECHFPPGIAGTIRGKLEGLVQVVNYLGSSYTRRKPWAEIDDISCLQSGCHDTRLLEGTVGFKGVAFDHGPHLGDLRRGKELRCTSCHSQIVQGDHIRVTETTCFLCHLKPEGNIETAEFERASDCRTCHVWDSVTVEQPTEITAFHEEVLSRGLECNQCHSKTIVGDGFVPHENCFGCHSEQDRLDKIDEIELLHRKHIAENKIECVQCHLQIQHKIQRVNMEQELDCATCHRQTHREQVMLFTGEVGNGERAPSAMFAAGLDCAGCHVFHEDAVGADDERIAEPQSCENCHGKGYNRLLRLWKEGANASLADFGRTIRSVESAARNAGSTARNKAEPFLDKAKKVLHVVQTGKPVHNVTFYDQLIRSGYAELESAVTTANLRVTVPEYRRAPTVPGECANCHAGIDQLSVEHEGLTFSHEIHVDMQGVTCGTCHSNAVRHGQVVLTMQNCNSCHHKETPPDVTCESCHEETAAIYAGTYLDKDVPDYMYSEEVECVDCHVPDDNVIRPTIASCLDCHDEGYDTDAEEWKTEIEELTQQVQSLMSGLPRASRSNPAYTKAASVLADFDKGAAGGIHNYELTSEVLLEVKEELEGLAGQ
jgi:nitrate/TMAO reductase-like tetraheme cytochrome c subunit